MSPGQSDRLRRELTAERERIVRTLLGAVAVLGLAAYVPSAWLGLRVGAYGIVAIDTLVYLAVLATLVFAAGRTRLQSVLLVSLCYVLGLTLSVTLGPVGAGPLWLAAVPAFAAVLFERREMLVWLAVVTVTGVAIGVAHVVGWVAWDSPPVGAPLWMVQIGNAILLGGAVGVAVTALVQRLRTGAERVARMTEELEEKHAGLLAAHKRAETEAKERFAAEEQLRKTEKLTAVGTLAAGVAHDFNNLLTPILAAPELLACDDLSATDRTRVLGQVEDAALAGRDLVKRILTFSRPGGAGRSPIPAGPAFGDAIRLLRATLPASVVFEVHIAEDAGHVLLTRAEVHQLVLNLGSNAHKAMADGGTIVFRLVDVEGGSVRPVGNGTPPDRAVRFTVTDGGAGMARETVKRIFDPFFTTDEHRGTGLGLATLQGIVHGAGGDVRCESELGTGTTFTIHLPVVEAVEAGARVRAGTGVTDAARRHVLLVDDDEPVRDVSARALRTKGYTVTPVADAPAALHTLAVTPGIGAVVTDLNMPGYQGTGLARRIRDLYPDVRVVLMTGLVDSELEDEARKIGIDALLAKPFRIDELSAVLERVLHTPGPRFKF